MNVKAIFLIMFCIYNIESIRSQNIIFESHIISSNEDHVDFLCVIQNNTMDSVCFLYSSISYCICIDSIESFDRSSQAGDILLVDPTIGEDLSHAPRKLLEIQYGKQIAFKFRLSKAIIDKVKTKKMLLTFYELSSSDLKKEKIGCERINMKAYNHITARNSLKKYFDF